MWRFRSGGRRPDRERALARSAISRRGHALALHQQRHADLQPLIVAAPVKVLEESATPDMQVTVASGSFKDGYIGALEDKPSLSAGAWQMRPISRGYVEAKSNRPGDAPTIDPRYLSEESDQRPDRHDGEKGRSLLTANVASAADSICGKVPAVR
jgi:choline dehydrogenase-like flavoprotein